jgi:hypothetical protein
VQGLREQLRDRDIQLEKQRSELEEKDRIIAELRREMSELTSDEKRLVAASPGKDTIEHDFVNGIESEPLSDDDY